jgi:hypothetical protein
MRALWLLPLLLAACAGPAANGGCAGGFTLSNQSGREIEQLYAGGAQDLLDPGTLPLGAQRSFFAAGAQAARLRVVFTDGRAAELGPVDLCALPVVVVSQGGIRASAR